MTVLTTFYAILGGIFPALIWLAFWLKEDAKNPEPRGLIILCFIAGMIAVPLVVPFQRFALDYAGETTSVYFLWAVIEEVFKFGAAYITVLRRREDDEPIDTVIYMITAALGFAALENILFLIAPVTGGDVVGGVVTGSLRFVGATLLHVVSSAIVGIFIAFVFYRSRFVKFVFGLAGLLFAIVLHTVFNLSIIEESNGIMITAFYSVWIAIVFLLLVLEKIKTIKSPLL